MKARLALYKDGKLVKAHALKAPGATIGRDPENSIELNDPEVSRAHARVRADYDMWVIEDLKSTNGILLDGKHVQHEVLKNHDEVSIGPFDFLFEAVADDQEWPEPSPLYISSDRRRRTKEVKQQGPSTAPSRPVD